MNPSNDVTVLSSSRPKNPRNFTVLGILTILLGIFCISSPLFIGVAIQYMVGTALVMGGIFQLLIALQSQQLRLFAFLTGFLTLACGGFLFAKPHFGISVITFLLIAYFISSGIVKILTALKLQPLPGWLWQLMSGGISLLLGGALWKGWPVSGAWAIGLFFGINLIFTGMVMLLSKSVTPQKNSPSSPVIDV